ncbi:hypothetical protein [Vagococcus penaei]|uniref:hypothetical protein n=1 Tax=Vagococcus penaei TaxID=633807 RepID=UPI000F87F17C|nr:hypothetical protein [Vagococcus penaei]
MKINKNGFEMEKLISENKKINEEINVTLEKFNNTIVPFLDFSLGLIEKDGKFDSVMEYSYIEGFVKSAYELTEETSNNSKQTEKLLQIANIKVLESFKYKVRCEYPEIYNDVDKLIITGSPIYIYDTYNISAIEVNIADLRDLANSLERSKKLLWQQDVDSLEDFYVNYIQ